MIIMKKKSEQLIRKNVKELDKILGKSFKVLNDGFVRVIDYLGSDESIVQAARVSFGEGTKKMSEDRALIRYLMRHRHTTPFEMCEIKLHLRLPMDCWRQWIRHRTASVNEYSTRYSVAINATLTTKPEEWRLQSTTNKQGSVGFLDKQKGIEMTRKEKELHDFARCLYDERLALGIAREQARKDLPLGTYTEAYWKIDLHNLLHFLSLRMDLSSQYEIRKIAEIIGYEIVSRWCPIAWESFLDYCVNTVLFSRLECEIVSAISEGDTQKAIQLAKKFGWLNAKDGTLKRNRERVELEEKLKKLKIAIPWLQAS
jgi:thymidylate synthase (FAD)